MRNAGLDEAQAGIKIAERNINNLRYADDSTLMAESEEELKSLLMKVKEELEKVGLKLNIQKMKNMASGTITSWQIYEETVETVADFILGGSKITANGDCNHGIKRHLLFEKKFMTNLDSVLEQKMATPVLLPGESHGWRSLVGYSSWCRTESDTIEQLHFHFSLFTLMHWRRKLEHTPVLLPGESQGCGSLVGCRLWGRTELDTTEAT